MGTLYVVGAGMAGLAAATAEAARGGAVVLLEMARHAGGRCRSFDDPTLGRRIDNGNHLILSGNKAVGDYLARIGTADRMVELAPAAFPFVDLATGERWTVRPSAGRLPWWLFDRERRPKGASLASLVRGMGLVTAGPGRTVADVLPSDDVAFARFWEPLAVGVLNTAADRGAAVLLRPVLLETFARGEAHCRPLLARHGLGDALVEPAVAWLRGQGAELRFGARVEALDVVGDRVMGLRVDGAWRRLAPDDAVVLATPPWATAGLVAGLREPDAYAPILNVHFLLADMPVTQPSLLGVVGGLAQWVFRRDDVAAVTVSAAEAVVDRPAEALASGLWSEVRKALRLPEDMALPPWRVVKERRATPVQSPGAASRRWPHRTAFTNLALAGDWTATGLPATIESAVRSGETATRLLHTRPHAASQQSPLMLAAVRS